MNKCKYTCSEFVMFACAYAYESDTFLYKLELLSLCICLDDCKVNPFLQVKYSNCLIINDYVVYILHL